MNSTAINKDKSLFVQEMFSSIAPDYDKMNRIMTFGLNKTIKKLAINKLPLGSTKKVLDLCTGTGDIAVYIAESHPEIEVVGVDFSRPMLEIAEKKSRRLKNITFIEGDALNLPFEDGYFDGCIISFGLRNLASLEGGLQEMRRVTKNRGFITNIDLGKSNILFNIVFRPYFFKIVPFLGKIFHGNNTPYQYLPSSGDSFPSQSELMGIMKEIGLTDVKNYDYVFGAIAQQVGKI